MGFWDSPIGEVLKFGGKAAIATFATGSIIATGGATAPLLLYTGATSFATGQFVKKVGEECNSEVAQWIGDTVSDTGIGVFTGGLGATSSYLMKTGLNTSGTKGINMIDSGLFIKEGLERYDHYSKVKEKGGYLSSAYHGYDTIKV